jgi:hypothetical protein
MGAFESVQFRDIKEIILELEAEPDSESDSDYESAYDADSEYESAYDAETESEPEPEDEFEDSDDILTHNINIIASALTRSQANPRSIQVLHQPAN